MELFGHVIDGEERESLDCARFLDGECCLPQGCSGRIPGERATGPSE